VGDLNTLIPGQFERRSELALASRNIHIEKNPDVVIAWHIAVASLVATAAFDHRVSLPHRRSD
jgi:hypothetical protein